MIHWEADSAEPWGGPWPALRPLFYAAGESMTRITGTRPVVRMTDDVDPCYGIKLAVRLEPKFVRIWQARHKRVFNVTYADIWRLGLMAQIKLAKADKKKRGRRAQPT